MRVKVVDKDDKEPVQKRIKLSCRLRGTQESRESLIEDADNAHAEQVASLEDCIDQHRATISQIVSSLTSSQSDIDNLDFCKAQVESPVADLSARHASLYAEV